MSHILNEICNATRQHVASQKLSVSESTLLEAIKHTAAPRGFINALNQKIQAGQFGLIAEIKKASPSAGLIREDFNPATIAQAYESGGATCLSVLTDTPYFQGKDEYLQQAKAACALPTLRKDFMLESYQIIESRVLGADCVLLIMACLSDVQAKELYTVATELDMDVLVEVHNHDELQRALKLDPAMIGINNRNLKTMTVDLSTSEKLSKEIPAECVRVCESGIHSLNDLQRMKKSGIANFLVGESLMRQDDITKATQTLLGVSA